MHIRRKTLTLATHPGRWLVNPLSAHYQKRYHGQHQFPRLLFGLDLLLVGVGIGILTTFIGFWFFGVGSLSNKIIFSTATVPTEVQSGAPTTLVINWKNTSDQELRHAQLALQYPDHFLLQTLVFMNLEIANNVVDLGTIPPRGMGSIKIRGVMFGDVGGEQLFTSTLSYRYGKNDRLSRKVSEHTFSPTGSALVIEATIPETIVSGQRVAGTLRLHNTSSETFSNISIRPGDSLFDFHITSGEHDASTRQIKNEAVWIIPKMTPDQKLDVSFSGRAPNTTIDTTTAWDFSIAFAFDQTEYFQGKTEQSFRLIPSPLVLHLDITPSTLHPGTPLAISGSLQNIADESINVPIVAFKGTSPFFAPRDGEGTTYNKKTGLWELRERGFPTHLDPQEEYLFNVTIPVRSSILQSTTNVYEHLNALAQLTADVYVPSLDARGSVETPPIDLRVTTPITLQSFGRYSSAQGDQIGRGPLPPAVGEETKYWVFWNITGTTNELENTLIEGTLPANVYATGKQSVSYGSATLETNGHVSWNVNSLPTTFGPDRRTIGIAFEVAITPTEAELGTIPTLVNNIVLRGRDTYTGELVEAFGARITTDLPNDKMAVGLSRVGI